MTSFFSHCVANALLWPLLFLSVERLFVSEIHSVGSAILSTLAMVDLIDDEMVVAFSFVFFTYDIFLYIMDRDRIMVTHHGITLVMFVTTMKADGLGFGTHAIPAFLVMEYSGYLVSWYTRDRSAFRYVVLWIGYFLNRVVYLTYLCYFSPIGEIAWQSMWGKIAFSASRLLHALMLAWFMVLSSKAPRFLQTFQKQKPVMPLGPRQTSALLFLLPAGYAYKKGLYKDSALMMATLGTSLRIHRNRPHFPNDKGIFDVIDPMFARAWLMRSVHASYIQSNIFVFLCIGCGVGFFIATRNMVYNSPLRNRVHQAMHAVAVVGSCHIIHHSSFIHHSSVGSVGSVGPGH